MTGSKSRASAELSANPILAWIYVAAWTAFIWEMGGEGFSLEGTSRFLGPLLQWLMPGISDATSDLLQFAIRKAAHVTEYAVLAFFAFRGFIASGWRALPQAAVAAFVLAVVFAAGDETRQSLSATRLGSVWDVALDALGAGTAIGLLLWTRIAQPRLGHWLGLSEIQNPAPGQSAATGPVE